MEKYDIVILAGQSNAEGNGYGPVTHKFKKNPKICILEDKNKGSIYFDDKGVLRLDGEIDLNIIEAKEYKNSEGDPAGNFSLSFAEQYLKAGLLKDDRKLLIVYAAVGGTGFAKYQWGNTAPLQKRMFKMVDYALSLNEENKVVAFLWHQGEHDAFESQDISNKTREKFYYEKFSYLIKEVRSKYGMNVVPLAGGFCNEWVQAGYYEQSPNEWVQTGYVEQSEAIFKATKKALKENGGEFIKTSDLLSNNQQIQNGDDIHFSRQSLYILGKRYFKAYKKIIEK